LGVAARGLRLDGGIFGALLAGGIAVGAKAPALGVGDEVAVRAVEVDVVDLPDGATGKAGVVLDEVGEPSLGPDLLVALYPAMPPPIGAGPHGVHARQPADIAGDDAARREQEAR